MNTPNIHTGPERRLQLALRDIVEKRQAAGWRIVTRVPLQMRRGRAVLTQLASGALTTSMEHQP